MDASKSLPRNAKGDDDAENADVDAGAENADVDADTEDVDADAEDTNLGSLSLAKNDDGDSVLLIVFNFAAPL